MEKIKYRKLKKITDLDENQKISLLDGYNRKELVREMAKRLCIPEKEAYRYIKDMNKEYRPYKYSHNQFFFNCINSEKSAYWLGFMYADGCVKGNKIYLGLAEKDKDFLEVFKRDIEATNPIYKQKLSIKGKTYVSYYLTISSKYLVNDLIKLGCIPKKSLTLKFPTYEQVPEHLMHHFIRGYFDGDGCVCRHREKRSRQDSLSLSIVGSKFFIESLQEYLINKQLLNSKTKLHNNGKAKGLQIGGNIQANKFASYIYNNATIFLKRKKDKFYDK